MSWQIGELRYNAERYSGIELVVVAVTSEAWAAA
jgi:hypothetical protein